MAALYRNRARANKRLLAGLPGLDGAAGFGGGQREGREECRAGQQGKGASWKSSHVQHYAPSDGEGKQLLKVIKRRMSARMEQQQHLNRRQRGKGNNQPHASDFTLQDSRAPGV